MNDFQILNLSCSVLVQYDVCFWSLETKSIPNPRSFDDSLISIEILLQFIFSFHLVTQVRAHSSWHRLIAALGEVCFATSMVLLSLGWWPVLYILSNKFLGSECSYWLDLKDLMTSKRALILPISFSRANILWCHPKSKTFEGLSSKPLMVWLRRWPLMKGAQISKNTLRSLTKNTHTKWKRLL